MKLFLIFLSSLLFLVSISLTKGFPVDHEENDEVFPEYLKPALNNTGDEPSSEIEEDEGLDEDFEFGETADLDEGPVSPVPILIPGKDNTKIQNSPEISSTPDEPADEEMSESEESDSTNNPEKNDRSEEGDEYSEGEESILEEIPEDNDNESSSRHAKNEPMGSGSKRPNPQHRSNESDGAEAPSSNTSSATENPEDEDDTIIIEACEDHQETCGSNALTRSDTVVCKAFREKCETDDTGEFVDTFFCPNGEC
ncbi:unnamed protein product [Allacma fusca]|uniref:Uncharacterized protein n=1 Tax=Allacma fusca TaxID=39272 RepID=A0A8J2K5F1_9HEXA|nr:unnamed protein product [Allacma fusca]